MWPIRLALIVVALGLRNLESILLKLKFGAIRFVCTCPHIRTSSPAVANNPHNNSLIS